MNEDILARYETALKIQRGSGRNNLIKNENVLANWIVDSHCFWYKRVSEEGKEYRLVDPHAASNAPAFDHSLLAKSLGKSLKKEINAADLPLKNLTITLSPLTLRFTAYGKHWQFDNESQKCEEIENVEKDRKSPFEDSPIFVKRFLPESSQFLNSPDGKKTVFVREHNLWLKDLNTDEEKPLTDDGSKDFSYSSNRCLGIDTAVQALWSPDSQRIFTIQRDIRKVVSRTFTSYVPLDGSLRPQEEPLKQSQSGREHIDTYHLAVIELNSGNKLSVDYPPIPLTRSGSFIAGFFRSKLGWWSPDNRHAYFVDVARGAKSVRVVRWDTHTGSTKVLFEETSDTYVRLSSENLDYLQFLPLPETEELVWFSARSGRQHLYFYDLKTGSLKCQLTEGNWMVRDVLHFDSERRELLIQTAGRNPEINPYLRDICKVNVDSGLLTDVASGNFEYMVYLHANTAVLGSIMLEEESGEVNNISPDGEYIVTTRSRVDTVPETLLIDRNGKEILTLEIADVSRLPDDWQWPEPVKLLGADKKTDVYGVVFRPPGFSPDKSYPVVEYNNAARCWAGVPHGSFMHSQQSGCVFFHASALAALGFIVVAIDGRGTPLRENSFSDYHYGDFSYASDYSDRIAGIRQLAERYPYMDLSRVGITSPEHPVNTVYALLQHSDFYKVAVQHDLTDPRFMPYILSEQYDGLVDPEVLNAQCYPEHFVDTFDGKLLLIVGMLSTTATDSTFRLVEALQKANKDFDMICLPNLHHEMSSYTTRREWDYLVKHLQGEEPPKGFQVKTVYDDIVEEFAEDWMELADYS